MSKKDEMLEEKKKSLYNLGNEFVELLELSEDGDISEEEFDERLQILPISFPERWMAGSR